MYHRPDYETARNEARFKWSAAASQEALRTLSGVPIREFNLDPDACIQAYAKGRPLVREVFGPDVRLPGVSTPAISYGHPNGLGAELIFPEGGEVWVRPLFSSLEEGIDTLQQEHDFASAGMIPFYLEFKKKLEEAFPGENVGFSCGLEGPITTAYELRGPDFFLDIYDHPQKTREYLRLVVESILQYHDFLCSIRGVPVINPNGAGMADDVSAMIPAGLWPEFVLPYWEQYYEGMTTGRRSAHIEDLKPAQLKYLEDIGLCHYDPSVSPRLNPRIIARECRVPFTWRFQEIHFAEITVQEVQDMVYQAVAEVASGVHAVVAGPACNPAAVEKISAFIAAAKRVEEMLASGCTRADIGRLVTPSARDTFYGYRE